MDYQLIERKPILKNLYFSLLMSREAAASFKHSYVNMCTSTFSFNRTQMSDMLFIHLSLKIIPNHFIIKEKHKPRIWKEFFLKP